MNDTFTFETEPFMQNSFGTPNLREFENEQSDFAMEKELRRGQGSPGRPMPSRSRPSGSNRYAGRKPPRPSPYRPRRAVIGPSFSHSEPAAIAGSEYVRWIQHCLNQAMNFHLPVTGVISPETRSAIRSFQKQQGLAVTGIAGPETKDALKAACGRRPAETDEFAMPAAGFDELKSAEVQEPITRAIQAVHPTQPANPKAQRIPTNRPNAIRAIDEALTGLDRIISKIQNIRPALRPFEAENIRRTMLNPIRQNLTAARGQLVELGRPGQPLTEAQANARWQAAASFLIQARKGWHAFLIWHKKRRTQHARAKEVQDLWGNDREYQPFGGEEEELDEERKQIRYYVVAAINNIGTRHIAAEQVKNALKLCEKLPAIPRMLLCRNVQTAANHLQEASHAVDPRRAELMAQALAELEQARRIL